MNRKLITSGNHDKIITVRAEIDSLSNVDSGDNVIFLLGDMGQILSNATGLPLFLREYHTFGRAEEYVDTEVAHPHVSKIHALIEWDGRSWYIKDVSTNGTLVNNVAVSPKERQILSLGDEIKFCGAQDLGFTVTDLSAPQNLLIRPNCTNAIALEKHHFFPNDDQPTLGVYFCPDRGAWYSEHFFHTSENGYSGDTNQLDVIERGPFVHGDWIDIEGDRYTFFLVTPHQNTELVSQNSTLLDDVAFRYDVSLDEESTRLKISINSKIIDLGERTHHYLIVHWLREIKRRRDALPQDQTIKAANQPFLGWVDVELMAKELGLEVLYINTLIFRARKQFTESLEGIEGASRLIERRRGVMRFNAKNVAVYKAGVRLL